MDQTLTPSFKKIFIHEDCRTSEVASRVAELYPQSLITYVDRDPIAAHHGDLTSEQYNDSKKILYLKNHEGDFFKRCPGASQKRALTCCNYHILNLGAQCNMNCSYCYLQSYLKTPYTLVYANIEQALSELKVMAEQHPQSRFRVGTGEVIDSLSLDPVTWYSKKLIAFFKQYPNWTLEFKTKSNAVDQFLNEEHAGNVVVSFSINSHEIVEKEEHGTASLVERLGAARKAKDKGFKVAFHMDPLIYYPDWQKGYGDLVREVCSRFTPQEVDLISLGSLRFKSEQRHMMRERFGLNSYVTQSEMFQSESGKMRYDQKVREMLYQFVVEKFRAQDTSWKTYLCMETPESWISSYGSLPQKVENIRDNFKLLPRV